MHLIVAGLSHKTAPVEMRERVAFPETELDEVLERLLLKPHLNEAVILSTCNRCEVYAVCDDIESGKEDIVSFVCRDRNVGRDELEAHLYFHHSEAVVHHLFRVSASLDSMMVGEAQILGQVKEAYNQAFEADAVSSVFNRMFRAALAAGKAVHTETEIGESAVSISYAAVELAKRIFEDLSGRTVMVVGAGEMSELTVKHLVSNGVTSVIVTNRTHERAVELADSLGGRAIRCNAIVQALEQADIIISSTGSPHFISRREDVAAAMRKRRHRPIFFIDIAVPRDIDPNVNKVENAFLYDIDELKDVVDANVGERMREAKRGEVIVDREVAAFLAWLSGLEAVPTIAALKERGEQIRAEETAKALGKLGELDDKQKNIVNALGNVIVNRLLHEPIVRAKESSQTKDGYVHVESLRHLFGLEGSAGEASRESGSEPDGEDG